MLKKVFYYATFEEIPFQPSNISFETNKALCIKSTLSFSMYIFSCKSNMSI